MPRSCQALHAVVARPNFSHNLFDFFFSFSFSTKLSAQWAFFFFFFFFVPVFTFLCQIIWAVYIFCQISAIIHFTFLFFWTKSSRQLAFLPPVFTVLCQIIWPVYIFCQISVIIHLPFFLLFFCTKWSDQLAFSSLFLLFLYFCADYLTTLYVLSKRQIISKRLIHPAHKRPILVVTTLDCV